MSHLKSFEYLFVYNNSTLIHKLRMNEITGYE